MTMHLQQLKGMQSSKQGMWKGYHLSIEGIWKGYLFREKQYIKGWGVGPRGGASSYKNLLSTPPGCGGHVRVKFRLATSPWNSDVRQMICNSDRENHKYDSKIAKTTWPPLWYTKWKFRLRTLVAPLRRPYCGLSWYVSKATAIFCYYSSSIRIVLNSTSYTLLSAWLNQWLFNYEHIANHLLCDLFACRKWVIVGK